MEWTKMGWIETKLDENGSFKGQTETKPVSRGKVRLNGSSRITQQYAYVHILKVTFYITLRKL